MSLINCTDCGHQISPRAASGETEIQVIMGGGFGKPKTLAKPGDRFEVGFRGFGKIYIAKVDALT